MVRYFSDNLLASAKRRGSIPDNAFSPEELLAIANEEMETYLAPLLVSAQEDYYESDVDFALSASSTATYRVPPRAIGNSLREISFMDAAGNAIDVPRIAVDDLEQASWGVIVRSQSVTYMNRISRQGPITLRMTIPLTPNLLVRAASAAVVTSIVGNVISIGITATPDWELESPPDGPAPTSFNGETSFDFVKSTPGFEILAFDQVGTCDGAAITLTGTVPTGLSVGDYACLANETPVPQCPKELWALLAQSTSAALLKQLGQGDQAKTALEERKLMETQVLPTIQNRIRGAPQTLNTRKNLVATTRRW